MKRRGIDWKKEIPFIKEMISEDYRVDDIAFLYGVNRSLIYRTLINFDVETGRRLKPNFLRGKSSEFKWLSRMLTNKGFSKNDRLHILNTIKIPKFCPVLGIKLDYENTVQKKDNSPSIDRINSNNPYTIENIHIISDRANRIKNDATPEELIKIANYFGELAKK